MEKYEPMGARPMAPHMVCAPRPQVSRWLQKEGSSFIPFKPSRQGHNQSPGNELSHRTGVWELSSLERAPGRKVLRRVYLVKGTQGDWYPTGVGWPEEQAWQHRAG